MPNHNNSSDIIVVKGTAPLEDLSQMKKFKMKPVLWKVYNYSNCISKHIYFRIPTQKQFPDRG